MKKIIFMVLVLVIFIVNISYALETGLFEIRNTISAESKQIKSLLIKTKDTVLVSSMWDSCFMTMTQLDAYFYMVGIYNSVKKADPGIDAINYLINWLKVIKSTNDLNIKSLGLVTHTLEPKTKVYLEKLKNNFGELNKKIEVELGRISLLKKIVKPSQPR